MPRRFLLLLSPLFLAGPAWGQTLAPGDNLVIENVPPIPAALAAKAYPYGNVRSATHVDWHPQREEMLILTRFADTAQVHLVTSPGGTRKQLTFLPESVGSASYEPTAGKYFIYTLSPGGSERYQLYRFDWDSGKSTLLTDGKSRNSGFRWSKKGDKLVYGSTRRNGADVDLYFLDPANPKSDRLFLEQKGGGWAVLDWAPDDQSLLVGQYISINESHLHRVDIKTKKLTRITPEGKEKVAYMGGKFSKDGKTIYTITDEGSEFRYLAVLDATTGKITRLSDNKKWDVQDFSVSSEGKIAYLVNEDGRGTPHLLEPGKGKLPAFKTPPGSISNLEWHPNGKTLSFHVTSATTPLDVYSTAGGESKRWTYSETAVPTKDFAEPKNIAWKSFDGTEITGYIYQPPKKFTGKRPVLILIHGGPESQSRPGFLGRYNYLIQEMGVAMVFPNVRGSSGYGKTFLQKDNSFQREDSYKDIGALFDWIAKQPNLDADRVMVMGGSYGGHMTLAVSYLYASKIRCAIDIVGISNLRTFLENTESYRRDLRRVEYGDERDPKMRAFLDKIAPMNHLDKITKPLFIIHGKNDPRVPVSEADQIRDALKKQKTPMWYLVANDEGHGFAKKRNVDFQFYATIMFVEEYLLKGMKKKKRIEV